jgi:ubiquinone biosynthesis protein COQ4
MSETTIPRVPKNRIQPRRAFRALNKLFGDQQLDSAFELLQAMGGDDHPTFQCFLDSPDGPRLLREQLSLVNHLADRTALHALPEGSLGHAYVDFAERNGIAAEAIVEANHEGYADAQELHPSHQWFFDRLNAMHDLWHVLTGYGTEGGGEALLVAFTCSAGVSNRGLRLVEKMIRWRATGEERDALRAAMDEAAARGAASTDLIGAPYEELLSHPLQEVRIRLGITPFDVSHPNGMPAFDLPAPGIGVAA